MNRIEKTFLAACVVAMGCSAKQPSTPEQNAPREQRPAMSSTESPKQPNITKEEVEEAMKKASTPGEQHAKLKDYAGTWVTTTKMWMDPNTPPEVTKGVAVNKMILGGRFLEQKYTGKMNGQKFEGQGLTGYDNVGKKYVSNWVDSMGTGQFVEEGTYDPAQKVIAMKGVLTCPITGKDMPARTVVSMVDQNSYVFEMHAADPFGGKEHKVLEITYAKAGSKPVKTKTETK